MKLYKIIYPKYRFKDLGFIQIQEKRIGRKVDEMNEIEV